MAVYDDQKHRGGNRTAGSDPLHHQTGIGRDEADTMEREAHSGAARDILERENLAAAGKTDAAQTTRPGGLIGDAARLTDEKKAKDTANRAGNLAKKESAATDSKSDSSESAADYKVGRKIKNGWAKFSRRKKITIFSVSGLVIFGGGGLGFLGFVTGPLQLVHASQLLSQFHLEEKVGQGDYRTILTARNIRYIVKGEAQKTRLGYLGNKIADKIELKFNSQGITSNYTGVRGIFTGYTIDPQKLSGPDFNDINDRSPQSVQKYLKEKFNIDATINGNNLNVNGRGLKYKQERLLLRSTMQLAGYHGTAQALGSRVMGVRNLIDWHPIKRIDQKILDSADKRLAEWRKKQRERISRGASAANATTGTRNNEDGSPNGNSGDQKSQTDEIIDEAKKANQAFLEGKPGALETFRNSIAGKFSGGAAGIVGIVCLALFIADNVDNINHQNIILPMTRLGMDMVTVGSQIQSGVDVDQEQLSYYDNLMHDRREGPNQGSWSDARSIQAELGQPLSGPDIPMSARLNQDGNIISRFIGAIPGARETCEIVGSTAGQIVLTGISLVLTGPLATIISTVVGAVGLPYLIDELTKAFAAAPIDPLAEGPLRGNFGNYGTRLAARDISLSNGGLPITDAEERQIGLVEKSIQQEDFQSRSLANRLFDTSDARSVAGRIIDQLAPNPTDNVARLGGGVLRAGSSLPTTLATRLSGAVNAAPIKPYDYGFPDYAYTLSQITDPMYANPFQNADLAAAALDAGSALPADSPDNYVYRAQTCFGVGLEKIAVTEQTETMWTVKAPVGGNVPLQKAVNDPVNKCNDPAEAWTRVRFFIFDSNMMNSLACYESIGKDAALTQACVDVGIEPAAAGLVIDNTLPTNSASAQAVKHQPNQPSATVPAADTAQNQRVHNPVTSLTVFPRQWTELLNWRPRLAAVL